MLQLYCVSTPGFSVARIDLVTRFFRELSAQLGQGRDKRLKDVAKVFSQLAQYLAPLSPVTGTTWLLS